MHDELEAIWNAAYARRPWWRRLLVALHNVFTRARFGGPGRLL